MQENTMVVNARACVELKMGNAVRMGVTGQTGSVSLVHTRAASVIRKDGIK
jgi:hypothetical protein